MVVSETDPRLHIVFVCTGNICRSPMAEVIIHDSVESAGLDDAARITSCGLGGWHVGQGADKRAIAELRRGGYDGSSHRASQLSAEDLDADLIVALDTGHRETLRQQAPDPDKVVLLRDFDPESAPDSSVADPFYGDEEDFARTRQAIEAAADGLMAWIRDHARD
ncbi:low molecular weight protein-tyrosine-phosphatase [Corynebacterium sp. 32222D000AT]|uniref:low molecular weight protein-tyrosine-phosphatase n=1 Tax=unclassified Corynebacterium TaxID=2624378 RepID=UPI002A9A37AF|nr:low molecular weight phosphotyrosine protein phosphatase [Mycobacteriaceae bacterium]MDY5830025.1 low molecular weight protein-tyrosine-phosphatase [Corynebacterium sp.]